MVFFQFFQAWNSRSETESVFRIKPFSNPFLFFAQLAVLYVPALQWLFRTTLYEWGEIIIASSVLVVERDKYWRRRRAAD